MPRPEGEDAMVGGYSTDFLKSFTQALADIDPADIVAAEQDHIMRIGTPSDTHFRLTEQGDGFVIVQLTESFVTEVTIRFEPAAVFRDRDGIEQLRPSRVHVKVLRGGYGERGEMVPTEFYVPLVVWELIRAHSPQSREASDGDPLTPGVMVFQPLTEMAEIAARVAVRRFSHAASRKNTSDRIH